jgi:hypothetical protein
MFKKILCATFVLTPLVAFAAPSENAYAHANEHASFLRAPEIDGGNLLLGLALLGGIISLVVRNKKK